MTTFNFLLSAERVAVAADTNMAAPDTNGGWANIGSVAKMLPIPHLQSIVVGCGNPGVLMDAVRHVMIYYGPDDICDAGPALANALRESVDDYFDFVRANPETHRDWPNGGEDKIAVALAGYSPRRQSCRAFIYDTVTGTWGEEIKQGLWGHPGEYFDVKEARKYLPAWGRDDAVTLAAIQFHSLPTAFRHFGFGGSVSAAEITSAGISITNHPPLETMPDPREAPQPAPTGMTRQQRRWMERKQRKATA